MRLGKGGHRAKGKQDKHQKKEKRTGESKSQRERKEGECVDVFCQQCHLNGP